MVGGWRILCIMTPTDVHFAPFVLTCAEDFKLSYADTFPYYVLYVLYSLMSIYTSKMLIDVALFFGAQSVPKFT